MEGYTQSGINMEWDTHGVQYIRSRTHTWIGKWDTDTECDTQRVGYTYGVGYTRSGIITEWNTYTEWDTHGVKYTRSEVHTECGVRYTRSWVYTEWDTHGVGSEVYRE